MYNYYYRQNTAPIPTTTTTTPTTAPVPTTTTTPTMSPNTPEPLTPAQPYAQMQEIIADIVELYHSELMNIKTYDDLLALAPNLEDQELIEDIIDNTNQNILYLEQIYLGLTGDVIDKLPLGTRISHNLSYAELLNNTLFSKTDTLGQYETIYRMIPIQPYKDVLFNSIIFQLKDATTSNYLISTQMQM